MRTAEKKREALRVKETPPATPSTPTIPPVSAVTEAHDATPATAAEENAPPAEEPAAEATGSEQNSDQVPTESQDQEAPQDEDQKDVPHQSIEVGASSPFCVCMLTQEKGNRSWSRTIRRYGKCRRT